jgi:hypothetical protein
LTILGIAIGDGSGLLIVMEGERVACCTVNFTVGFFVGIANSPRGIFGFYL